MAPLARQHSAMPRPIPLFAPVTRTDQLREERQRAHLLAITFPARVICTCGPETGATVSLEAPLIHPLAYLLVAIVSVCAAGMVSCVPTGIFQFVRLARERRTPDIVTAECILKQHEASTLYMRPERTCKCNPASRAEGRAEREDREIREGCRSCRYSGRKTPSSRRPSRMFRDCS